MHNKYKLYLNLSLTQYPNAASARPHRIVDRHCMGQWDEMTTAFRATVPSSPTWMLHSDVCLIYHWSAKYVRLAQTKTIGSELRPRPSSSKSYLPYLCLTHKHNNIKLSHMNTINIYQSVNRRRFSSSSMSVEMLCTRRGLARFAIPLLLLHCVVLKYHWFN